MAYNCCGCDYSIYYRRPFVCNIPGRTWKNKPGKKCCYLGHCRNCSNFVSIFYNEYSSSLNWYFINKNSLNLKVKKMNKKLIASSVLVLLLLPVIILAFNPPPQPIEQELLVGDVVDNVLRWIVWPFVTGLVIILFIWAGFLFLSAKGEPGKIDTAKKAMTWAVIGVVIAILGFSAVKTIKFLLNIT